MRPTLLNSCAMAATAREASYRIDIRIPPSWRAARIVALDPEAAAVVHRVAAESWAGARFFTTAAVGDRKDAVAMKLRSIDGSESLLVEQLADADVAVLVATSAEGADVASAIGAECSKRGIMTAGVVLGARSGQSPAVTALRSSARVLLVSDDARDVADLLRALRA